MKPTSRKIALGLVAAAALFVSTSSAFAHRVWSDWYTLGNGYSIMNHHSALFARIFVGDGGSDYTRVQNTTAYISIYLQAHQYCSDGSQDYSTSGMTVYNGTRTTTLCPLVYNPSWGRGLMGEN